MPINNAFRDVALELSSKQPELVDYILEEAPILEMIPTLPSTNGLHLVYEEQGAVAGNGMVDFDAPLPSDGSDS